MGGSKKGCFANMNGELSRHYGRNAKYFNENVERKRF